MAVFLDNTGLEVLLKDGSLDQKQMLAWFEQAKRIVVRQGLYATKLLDSGLTVIFRVVSHGSSMEVAGIDMHMSGRCIWSAKPLVRIGTAEPLAITLLMSNPSESCAFVATLVHAATLEVISEDTILNLQVCGFVRGMDVYTSREEYENSGVGFLEDKKVLALNYLRANDESLDEKTRREYEKRELETLVCGPVLAIEERSHHYKATHCMVATIATEMGHLDLVFGPNQQAPGLKYGSYVVASCILSADVMVDD